MSSYNSIAVSLDWCCGDRLKYICEHIARIPGNKLGLHEVEKDGVRYLAFSTSCCNGYIYYKSETYKTYCSVCGDSDVSRYNDSVMEIDENSNEQIAMWLRLYAGFGNRKVERV